MAPEQFVSLTGIATLRRKQRQHARRADTVALPASTAGNAAIREPRVSVASG